MTPTGQGGVVARSLCGRVAPCRARRRSNRGQATVEFALVLPFLVMLIVGVVQVARLTALQVATVDAARAGARAAAVTPRLDAVRAAVGPVGTDGTVTLHRAGGAPGTVTVTVTHPVDAVPFIGWSGVELRASSTMAVEPTD